MSLAGHGAVAIWHDIAAEGRAEFYAWHGQEHMPERAGIVGFLRGRRFVAVSGQPEYFNLYETVSPATVKGPDYLSRLNAPTPWTKSAVRHFRGVARSLCAVAASFGAGQGGLIATFRYAVDDARADTHRTRMTQTLLPALAARADIAGCHLLVADAEASAVKTAEQNLRSETNLVPRWVLLVESWSDIEPFAAQCDALLQEPALQDATEMPALAIYRLQNSRGVFPWSAG